MQHSERDVAMTLKRITLRWPILLAYALIVVALTTLPGSVVPVEWTRNLFTIAGHPALHDALGHGALYGTLTAVLYWALRGRIGFRRALPLTLVAALLLGLTTELLQHFAPGRTVQ